MITTFSKNSIPCCQEGSLICYIQEIHDKVGSSGTQFHGKKYDLYYQDRIFIYRKVGSFECSGIQFDVKKRALIYFQYKELMVKSVL